MTDTYLLDIESSVAETARVGYIDHTVDTRFLTTGVKKIYLNCTQIGSDQQVHLQAVQQPGKPSTFTAEQLLPYGDFCGVASPTIRVQGVIDLAEYSAGVAPIELDNDDPSFRELRVTLLLLHRIAHSGHLFELYDYYDEDVPQFRAHTVTGAYPYTASHFNVKCTSLSYTINAQTKEGAQINYNMTFKEVRES
jgi:hypothetical protein